MKTSEQNGKRLKSAYKLLQSAGQGIKFAANTGYKTGYFMAKHPEIEMLRDGVKKNYISILLALGGIILGIIGITKIMANSKK
jgi:hypothetical protein